MITATPINISIEDLTNIIDLLNRGLYKDILEKEKIIEHLIKIKRYLSSEEYESTISKEFLDDIGFLLKKLVIRVTWMDILENFKNDVARISGKAIEKIEQPEVEKVSYKYSKEIIEKVFENIVDFLQKLNFEYVKLWKGEVYEEERTKYLIGWFKWKLYKRLESSLEAFKISLEKMLKRTSLFYDFLSEKINIEEIERNSELRKEIRTYLNSEERIKKVYEIFQKLSDLNKKRILKNLEEDIKSLKNMLEKVNSCFISKKFKDEKIEKLREILQNEKKPTIIFTESADTAKYIYENLKDIFKEKIILVHGKIREKLGRDLIEKDFNTGKVDIIVSTDVLSEGIDLDRADIVINFDLPYNPVKLIQRDGRAFRITNPKKFKIYNFVPHEKIDKEIELLKKLNFRIDQIIKIMGIDFMFWVFEREKNLNKLSSRKIVEEYVKEWKDLLSKEAPDKLVQKVFFHNFFRRYRTEKIYRFL